MKRVVLLFGWLLVGVALLAPLTVFAGPGKIAGTVLDESKEAVIGASVQLIQTQQGAPVQVDGNFLILGVQPGTYSIRFTCVGYATQLMTGVEVTSDNTTTLHIVMKEEAVQTTEQIIVFQAPNVKLDVVGKDKIIGQKEMQQRPMTNIASLLKKQPGFKVDPEGAMHVRGGRASEMLVKVDGVDFRDPLVTSSKQLVNLSALNVEEIEVMTGGDARYGGFQSALVNVTTPEGSSKDYSGVVEWRTDRMFKTADPYKAFQNQAHKLWEASFNTDQYDYSLSGPVPFAEKLLGPQKLSFFTSGTARLSNTYTPYDVNRSPNDILGTGLNLPERQNNDYSTFWKFTYRMDPTRKLNLSFQRDFSQWDVYPDGEAAIDGNYGWQYKYDVANRPWVKTSRQSISLQFSHNVSKNTLYEISVGNFTTTTKIEPRGMNPDQFTLSTKAEDDNRKQVGSVDQDKNGFYDGFVDANGDGKYEGTGEGYDDVNGNGRWDKGEDFVDLNGNGVYDAAEPFVDVTDPVTGKNNIGVWDPWDPYVDLNHNGRWDPAEPQLAEQDWNHNGHWDGERFQDANHNGKYDGTGEGFDDQNLDGKMDHRTNFDPTKQVQGEPFVDGDYWFDTGEPFIDLPDSAGNYNGMWDIGEPWFDLPSSYMGTFAPRSSVPTTNGHYDAPNGAFDEYELFTYPANLDMGGAPLSHFGDETILDSLGLPIQNTPHIGMDSRYPVLYTWEDIHRGIRNGGREWLSMGLDPDGTPRYLHFIPGKSTWTNVTLDDQVNPIFDPPNYQWDNGKKLYPGLQGRVPVESFTDYNHNGVDDPLPDFFLRPGQYDATALWMHRTAVEWNTKFDLTSQVNKSHELKTGFELKYRELSMQSISAPDQVYANTDVPLPAGSPYPDRGGVRDFYEHKPWEGAAYFQDKMEFEGMIVRAGIRSDFIIQPNALLEETQKQIDSNQPGALLAKRGRFALAPRLGISHPISTKSKMYFNYGHYYQTPSFQYFYQSATANLSPNTLIGNPNLEYEKTVSYEVGVNTEFAEDWVADVAGYYRDVFNQIGTVTMKDGPLTLNRFFNLGYARARGFEFTLEKKFSNLWAVNFSYDFSYAYGKESAATDGLTQRVANLPENRDEHPLGWDQTHTISAYFTFMANEKDQLRPFGVRVPNNWLTTFEVTYGSGYPYTPSTYSTGIQSNMILPNSARMPETITTELKVDKFWNLTKTMKLTTGFEVYNLLDRDNVRALYAESGNTYQNKNIYDPTYVANSAAYDMNPRNYQAPRQILLHLKLAI